MTLVAVVLLLLTLASQAGLLAPPARVAGGAVLAAELLASAARLRGRTRGHTGAVALAATGIAAALLDVVAVTAGYGWLPAQVGLFLAGSVGEVGLSLARRWDSEYLAVLVLASLACLAPVLTSGFNLLLVGFVLALSAATLPVQLGRDWTALSVTQVLTVTGPHSALCGVLPT